VVSGEQTIAVILVGPTLRPVEHLKEFGRTITLLMSVAITNLQVLRREQHLATTDGLTSLLNKRAVLEHLESCLSAGKAHRVSVFLFDVDHFKHYNDTNGHLAGDELLRAMGRLIREHSRDGEGLGRYGGEEFVLVMNDVDKPAALAAADRLRNLVSQAPFPYGEAQPGGRLTISGGVATWPTDGSDVATLLRAADEALYVSKRGGRNRVTAYHAPEFAPLTGDAELTAEEEVADGEE
jgi:diguanylate cyclase (GGDEF)-like protein